MHDGINARDSLAPIGVGTYVAYYKRALVCTHIAVRRANRYGDFVRLQ
jgi:hypothetical protein